MRRIKILLVLLTLTMAVMSGAISNRNQTLAADYRCTTTTCPGLAQCSGDHWTQTGNCAISCYKDSGAPGQIVFNGSANCSPPPSGGGGGGPVGFYYGGENGYCYENWWWDSACSGPDDPYRPSKIN
jgi:hypothetical protein